MRIKTRRNLVRVATFTALACTAAVSLLPGAASAAPATVAASINVRPSPSTQYPPIDKLYVGERIDVKGCRGGWCYVTHDGPAGYVQAQYLRTNGVAVSPNFNLSFNFPGVGVSVGNGGVSLGIGTLPGDNRPGRPVRPGNGGQAQLGGDVCFYSGAGYTGSQYCLDEGASVPFVGRDWNNRISSFRNPQGSARHRL